MKYVIVLFISSLFLSCTSFRKFKNYKKKEKLASQNISILNGKYELSPVGKKYELLDFAFFGKSPFNRDNRPSTNDYLTLEVISKRKIKVSCFQNGQLYRSKVFKGRIKNDCFIFRRKFFLKFGRAIWVVGYCKTRVGIKQKNANLIVDHIRGGIGFFLIIPLNNGGWEFNNLEFQRIE